jgi:MscS family membrane protein
VAFLERLSLANDKSVSPLLISVIGNTLRIIIVSVGLITLLSNFNINVVSLVAGLGVGGLAVALAVQDPLGNFFGFVALLSDSPFRIGDWIQMGVTTNRVDGIVEYVGFRSTRIRTFSRSLLTIPNNLISKDIVENFSVLTKRRVKQTLLLSLQTPPEVISSFLKDLRALLTNDEGVDQEQIIAYFDDFSGGGYSLLIQYYTKTTAYEPYLQVKERINLAIVTLARKFDLSLVSNTSCSFPVKFTPAESSVKK